MAVKTYGDKPVSFQIEEGGEFYMMGSEVGIYNNKTTVGQIKIIFFFVNFRSETIYNYVVDCCTESTREWPEKC